MSIVISGTVVSIIGAGVGAYSGIKSMHAQQKLAEQQKRQAELQEQQARLQQKREEEAFNRTNRKKANQASLLANAQGAGRSGLASTLLTGSRGVQTNNALGSQSLLGRNTLLGQ